MSKRRKRQAELNTEFDPKTHIGRVNGVIWPSVTQLLREFGIVDYSGVPHDRLEHKRKIGVRVGIATTMIDNGNLDEDHFKKHFPECVPYTEGYRKFRTIENFTPVRKETRYFSKKWKFHGAPDEQGIHSTKKGNRYVIIDYKCTWKMYESTGPQTAAYKLLVKEALGIDVHDRYGLLLKPSGTYDLIPFKDPMDENVFLYCAVLHWQKRRRFKTLTERKLRRIYSN